MTTVLDYTLNGNGEENAEFQNKDCISSDLRVR